MRIHKHKMPNQMCSHKLNCMFPFQLQKWSPLIWQHQITRNSLWIWSVCSEEEWIAISSFLFFFSPLSPYSLYFFPTWRTATVPWYKSRFWNSKQRSRGPKPDWKGFYGSGQSWTCCFNIQLLHFPQATRQVLTAEPLCIFNSKYMYIATPTAS